MLLNEPHILGNLRGSFAKGLSSSHFGVIVKEKKGNLMTERGYRQRSVRQFRQWYAWRTPILAANAL